MNGTFYLRRFSEARQRANSDTPDLFSANRFKIFGIRRALQKLGASPTADLETLGAHDLEQMRVEIATQLSYRKRGASSEHKQTERH